ncbi:MAG: double zinc ribbon domain-containing protein [Candidatus Rifleibacteriota bacterium]
MIFRCPKCNSNHLDNFGSCSDCGYTFREICSNCGFKNIPKAKYCGNCGTGMNIKIQLQNFINRNFSFSFKIRFRKFITGLAFGTLLSLFALSGYF